MTSRSTSRIVVSALAGVLVAAQAAPASATVTVSTDGVVTGDGADDRIEVHCVDGVLYASGVTAGESCATVTDLLVAPDGGIDTVLLGDVGSAAFPRLRQPHVDVREGVPDPRPGDVVSGSSLGDLIEGDWRDHLLGQGGDDVIVGGLEPEGGPGDDVMQGAGLRAHGGDGDDRFVDTGFVDGGPGFDTWEAHLDVLFPPSDRRTYVYTPNGLHFDGELTSGGWGAGVEAVDLTLLPDGVESYDGSTFGGPQVVHGLAGLDTLRGGPGADALFGGPDDDVVEGGGGADVVDLGDGDDTAQTRDGVVDVVSCGPGADAVTADAMDELVGCETVSLPRPRTGRIRGRGVWVKPAVARFVVSSSTPGATFQCRLDGRRWKHCSSRPKVRTARLDTGRHTFRVRAVLAGMADRTPAVRELQIRPPRRP